VGPRHWLRAAQLTLAAAINSIAAGAVLFHGSSVLAQELNPRAYVITPTGFNAASIGYSHQDGSLTLGGGVPITGATADVNAVAFGYYRSFALWGRSANVAIGIPYAFGEFSGTVAQAPRSAHRSGLLDSSLRLSVNLLGGPAMVPAEFKKWTQDVLLGVSLQIVAPSGQYDPTALVNWGGNRWAFKPEIGYSQRWGHWLWDAYGAVWFFTENPEYFSHNVYFPGSRTLTQSPTPAFEGHLSYDIRPRFWVSLDVNYWTGGETTVGGVPNKSTYQKNSRFGFTASVPVTVHQSVKLSFSKGAYIRYGGDYKSASAVWQYAWF
jgi:hypothetical protein